jgi:large subunit ribosomal protein L13Ae
MSRTCIQNFLTILLPQELEEKRKERAQLVYERKKQLTKLRVKAEKAAEEKLGPQSDILAMVKY